MGKKLRKNSQKVRSKRKKTICSRSAKYGWMKKMNDNIDSTGIDLNNLPSPLSASSDETLQISEKLKISAQSQSNTARSTGTGNATSVEQLSLQQAFLKFREKRQNEILVLKNEEEVLGRNVDENRMEELRSKFLEKCKHYIGVPYKKKYHKPGTPEYQSKLFLDCCGLVRRALRDLRREFGFRIGPWNQAYMYDTLPIAVKEEEMKPGDLVFISGVYFNRKLRAQAHNMVHVEVWLGEGPKTVGARWHKGRVQIFDSYQFVSTSYHSMTYHFRSIDTWLQGICKSFCQVHPWRRPKRHSPSKKSVFYRAQSPVTPENQLSAEENLEDIVDIDASEEESDNSSVSKRVKSVIQDVDKLCPCREQSNEEVDSLPSEAISVTQCASNSQIAPKENDNSTAFKYISFSKKLDVSNFEKYTQNQESDSTSSCCSSLTKSLPPQNTKNLAKPLSKSFFVFTNKPLSSQATSLDVQGNKVVSIPSKTSISRNVSETPRPTSGWISNTDNKTFEAADQLVTEAIERALAELRESRCNFCQIPSAK